MAELAAASAFMAQGYVVMEPLAAETYDMVIYKDGEYIRVQTKMMAKRERNGVEYYVCKGRRNTGNPYTLAETDVFAGVCDGKVYVIANSELSEYWCKVDEADTRWLLL